MRVFTRQAGTPALVTTVTGGRAQISRRPPAKSRFATCVVLMLAFGLAAPLQGCRKKIPRGRGAGDRVGGTADGGALAGGSGGADTGADPGGESETAVGQDEPRMIVLPACPAAPAPNDVGAGEGTLRVRLVADPPNLDPLDESSELTGQVMWQLVHESLLVCPGRDESNPSPGARAPEPTAGLATRWQISPNGDLITVQLRPGAIFHDGHPVTSTDVRATFETVWHGSGRMPQVRAALADLAAFEIASADTFRLRLKRPAPIVLRALCDLPIVPAGWLSSRRPGGPARDPIGSGPYRFASWQKGKVLRLVRFARPGLPPAPLSEIVFLIEPDTGKALGQLRRGGIDLVPRLDAVHYPDQVRPAALGPGLDLLGLPAERTTFIAVNHRKAPLSVPVFRRALSLLWDRVGLAEEIHRGLVTPIAAPPFARLPPPAFDPTLAAQLLRDASLVPPAPLVKGRAVAIVHRLTLLHSGGRIVTAELRRLAERLRRLGILLDLVALEPGPLLDRVRTGQFDLALLSWRSRPYEDPRPRFAAAGPYNFGGFRSARLEALLDELRATDGSATRVDLDHRLATVLAQELPAIFLYRHTELALASTRVRGLCNDGGRLDFSRAGLGP
jgi:peptide/nickel transport system substrate-binding protein